MHASTIICSVKDNSFRKHGAVVALCDTCTLHVNYINTIHACSTCNWILQLNLIILSACIYVFGIFIFFFLFFHPLPSLTSQVCTQLTSMLAHCVKSLPTLCTEINWTKELCGAKELCYCCCYWLSLRTLVLSSFHSNQYFVILLAIHFESVLFVI